MPTKVYFGVGYGTFEIQTKTGPTYRSSNRAYGLSRSMIYKLLSTNSFPAAIQLGEHAVGWRQIDTENWLENKSKTGDLRKQLPVIYTAGRMGSPVNNKEPGREFLVGDCLMLPPQSKMGI